MPGSPSSAGRDRHRDTRASIASAPAPAVQPATTPDDAPLLSVRQAGAATYLNFGRNWTRDFAATISRRALSAFEAAGIGVKSLENRRIRVHGWVEARGGPRTQVLHPGQIESLGVN